MKQRVFIFALFLVGTGNCLAQSVDTTKPVKDNAVHAYFIISAGDVINAYYKDKPLEIETISDFNQYVQSNAKTLKDAWVVVTGKPKTGTFDEVIKTLSHYRIKHVEKNILTN